MSKPINTSGEVCPFHQKDVKKVCHTCPLYIQLRGVDPNTGREVDNWGCSFSFLPMIMLENTQASRHTSGSIDALRNEQASVSQKMMTAAAIAAQQMKKLE